MDCGYGLSFTSEIIDRFISFDRNDKRKKEMLKIKEEETGKEKALCSVNINSRVSVAFVKFYWVRFTMLEKKLPTESKNAFQVPINPSGRQSRASYLYTNDYINSYFHNYKITR